MIPSLQAVIVGSADEDLEKVSTIFVFVFVLLFLSSPSIFLSFYLSIFLSCELANTNISISPFLTHNQSTYPYQPYLKDRHLLERRYLGRKGGSHAEGGSSDAFKR